MGRFLRGLGGVEEESWGMLVVGRSYGDEEDRFGRLSCGIEDMWWSGEWSGEWRE
jgi:hypothetical protein